MKYQVQENGKPCNHLHHHVPDSYKQSTYETFEEAVVYLNDWLGDVYGPVPKDFKLEDTVSGFGRKDNITIVEIGEM